MKKTLLALCALALSVVFSACSSQIPINLGVELASLSRDGQATVRFVNPSVVAYNIAQSTHRVYLDGKLAGTIALKNAAGIPSQRSTEQAGIFTPEKGQTLAAGRAMYQLESRLTLTLYGETTQVTTLKNSGTVVVK
jgi:hypothetical protein